MTPTEILLTLNPEQVKPLDFSLEGISDKTLSLLGVNASRSAINDSIAFCKESYAEDAAPTLLTDPNIGNAIQFFQYYMPGAVRIVTTARKADDLLGRTMAGTWDMEEVVMPVVETTSQAQPYGDMANESLASFNINFERRNIIRLEAGFDVRALEQARTSRMRQDAYALKREAVATALTIAKNDIAFNGYANGVARTYGILNEPGLPSYSTVPTGTSGDTDWTTKTFMEIVNDIKNAMADLRVRSGTNFDPFKDEVTLGIASNRIDMLSTVNEFGVSVMDFLNKTYKGLKAVPVPQFSGANGGENVFYLIADSIEGQKTVHQLLQDNLRLLGIMKLTKGHREDYAAATAGVMVTVPIGLARWTGI